METLPAGLWDKEQNNDVTEVNRAELRTQPCGVPALSIDFLNLTVWGPLVQKSVILDLNGTDDLIFFNFRASMSGRMVLKAKLKPTNGILVLGCRILIRILCWTVFSVSKRQVVHANGDGVLVLL